MATGFMVAAGSARVIGGVKQRKAEKAQSAEEYRLAQENIALEKAETEESIRRTGLSQRKTEGMAKTQVAASGFAVGSSLDKYVESMKAEHASDIDWMRTSGASRAEIAERESAARLSASESASKGRFISNIGSSIGAFGGAATSYKQYGWGF